MFCPGRWCSSLAGCRYVKQGSLNVGVRLSTLDLLVLTSFLLKILFTLFKKKQVILMRRSTVLNLPLQLVIPALSFVAPSIFSHVWPFYEQAVSDLDRSMHRSQVAHSSFIEGSHTTKNSASVLAAVALLSNIRLGERGCRPETL